MIEAFVKQGAVTVDGDDPIPPSRVGLKPVENL
jgi:hypothetical protein